MDKSGKSSPRRPLDKRLIFWVAAIIGVFLAFQFLPAREWLGLLERWIDSLGFWGPLVFSVIYVLATVLLLPGAAMTPLAGLLFGLGKGTLVVVIASNIGASLSFLIGRYLARDAVAKRIEEHEKLSAIDRAVGNEGWKIVGLTRLSPAFPFVLLNYAYGLTRVRWIHYASASLVGMIPGTVMYVYLGSLGKLASDSEKAGTGRIVLTLVGLVATILVTLLITRAARRALREKTDLEE
jgi:uncharacterized membrane protein YdjX (TVP38/TMEM64 family)